MTATSFRDAVAVVTGGASGLGRALCEELGRRGARVVVTDVQEAGARAVARWTPRPAPSCAASSATRRWSSSRSTRAFSGG